jgi:hypothetical protein
MLREHSLLGVDTVEERYPTNQYQDERDRIPFLEVVPNIRNYV